MGELVERTSLPVRDRAVARASLPVDKPFTKQGGQEGPFASMVPRKGAPVLLLFLAARFG